MQDVVESWVNKEGNSLSKEEIETYKGELKEFIRLSGGEKDREKMPSSLRDNVVENLKKYGYDPELRQLEAELDGTALTGAARRVIRSVSVARMRRVPLAQQKSIRRVDHPEQALRAACAWL